jgi:hypothetical protein
MVYRGDPQWPLYVDSGRRWATVSAFRFGREFV